MSDFVRPPWSSPATSSVLVEGPALEPITLDEAYQRAGFARATPPPDPRDGLMRGFIKAARSKVEHDTGLALLTQTRKVTIPATTNGLMSLPAQAMPVQSVTLPDGSPVDPGFFDQDLTVRGLYWTAPTPGGSWVVVAGWVDVETLTLEAPLLVHAVGLLVAHYATLGRDLASIDEATEIPFGYEEAIAPYRVIWLP